MKKIKDQHQHMKQVQQDNIIMGEQKLFVLVLLKQLSFVKRLQIELKQD